MTTVEMKEYGATLTDREDGKKAATTILERMALPLQLDFSGVMALGSSFGEELVLRIAEAQDNSITVVNANNVIKNSLYRIAEGTNVHISFDG
jgi:hypothetical protein